MSEALPEWRVLDRPICPAEGEVHVWRVSLNLDRARLDRALRLLSPDELARAKRYAFEDARARFIACRSSLRTLLAGYLAAEPGTLSFRYGQFGKPELAASPSLLTFNVSHCDTWAIIAIAAQNQVGVDIERLRDIKDMDYLAETIFSLAEIASYRNMPIEGKVPAFFNGWTRKEAFIKANGKGLSYPLRSFTVTLEPNQEVRVVEVAGEEKPAARWLLTAFTPVAGYVAAVAIDRPEAHFKYFDLYPATNSFPAG